MNDCVCANCVGGGGVTFLSFGNVEKIVSLTYISGGRTGFSREVAQTFFLLLLYKSCLTLLFLNFILRFLTNHSFDFFL